MEIKERNTLSEMPPREPRLEKINKASSSPFKPAWWLPGPHLQTLWPTLCRRPVKNISLRRERFELPDGDFVDLDWIGQGHGPIILILHGLEGSINSPYAKGMLRVIHEHGWRGVLMHFRGCSGEVNRSLRSYHSGETDDVASVVAGFQIREPSTEIAAIGFSLGGNVLLKWLGESGHKNPLKAAIGISVPFELHKSSKRIQQGFSRLYQHYFLKELCQKTRKKFASKPAPFKLESLGELKTIREFDDKVTAPLHGFANVDEYYTKASCRQFLNKIKIPTLLVQAKDDPFMTEDLLPNHQELAPDVTLELTEKGGHVGFVSGSLPWRAEYWLERRVPEFFLQHLRHWVR